ncbi:MAG: dihydrodipicolinate synthase family protein [Halobacteriales archaeon]
MAHEAVKAGLRDVATGILTPFDDGGDVDHDALADNAAALCEQGVDTVMACPNVGEYHSLTHDERIAVVETSVAAVPADATVLAAAGGATRTAIDLAGAHAAAGADAIMVMPPDHTYRHERGLLAYYEAVGDAVDLPLVPYLRGFDPSVGFVADLTHLDAVAGVKWTLEDVPKFADAVAAGADDVVWLNGLGEPYALALHAEGAEGLSSGIGNFEPALGLALFDALAAGEVERAREIRAAAMPIMNFRDEVGENNTIPAAISIPVLKACLECAGLHGGPVREPLVELSAADRERASELYEDLAAFIAAEL